LFSKALANPHACSLLFSFTGEMLMVMKLAADGRPLVYLAASMWPAGFYPLIKQLLKQRKKHFSKQNAFKSD